jgi:hypothetical protein
MVSRWLQLCINVKKFFSEYINVSYVYLIIEKNKPVKNFILIYFLSRMENILLTELCLFLFTYKRGSIF